MTLDYWVKRLAAVDDDVPEFNSIMTLMAEDGFREVRADAIFYAHYYKLGFKDARKTEESARETIESTGGPSTEDQG